MNWKSAEKESVKVKLNQVCFYCFVIQLAQSEKNAVSSVFYLPTSVALVFYSPISSVPPLQIFAAEPTRPMASLYAWAVAVTAVIYENIMIISWTNKY